MATPAPPQCYADEASALVEAYLHSDLFSGSVLVAHHHQVLFRRSFGLADRAWEIPNTPETRFRIGSVTKQFTAAAILQLIERGKLKLEDSIADHYLDAPATWRPITIRHLLVHTSGIPSYTALADFAGSLSKLCRTPEEIIALTRDAPLDFEPGTQFAYNNSGYVLLGYVIEKVTGQSYARYLEDSIFNPLGLTDTGYDDGASILPRRAAGYRYLDAQWKNAASIDMSLPYAAGALYSTIDDLLRWEGALSGGQVIGAALLQAMFADHGHAYGYGFVIRKQFDRPLQTHNGGINGFRATLDHYPEDELTVIALSNIEIAPVEKIARELAAIRLGVAEAPRAAPVDPALLDGYVGHYQLGPRFVLTVTRQSDQLFVQATRQPRMEVFAESDRVFFSKVVDVRIAFEVDPRGQARRMVLHQNGGERPGTRIAAAEAKRIEDEPPKEHKQVAVDPRLFDGLIGRYRLFENFVLAISREGDRLFSQATGQPKVEIFPESDHEFFLKVVDAQITFECDQHARAHRLVLHQGGLDTPAARID
jgi:CubicO group peptidase (beta-lactamase class C family)